MFQQLLRVVGIFFSEILLWLATVGALEVLFVFGAGALCVLTAGFLFEGMKKNPVVLVLGSAVALTGTFLMYRELKGMFWPGPPAVIAAPAPTGPPPATKTPAPTYVPPKPTTGTIGMCWNRGHDDCLRSGCSWSYLSNNCQDKIVVSPPPVPTTLPSSFCNGYMRSTCDTQLSCYWSVFTNRCEQLKFGGGVFTGTAPSTQYNPYSDCWAKKSESACRATTGCTWWVGTCLYK